MIDLRSDTVSRPTAAMRRAMAEAPVGDDVYGDDPTVAALEAIVAGLLSKEAAVFMPTGTMTNQIGLRIHGEPGDTLLLADGAHIYVSEGGAASAYSGLTLRAVPADRGVFTAEALEAAIGVVHPFVPVELASPPRIVSVENTSNAGGGRIWPIERIRDVAAVAKAAGLMCHLDGARIWNASAASGISVGEYAAPFDTVSVCFSKGLGAPVGSCLAGTRVAMVRARRFRQQIGGSMRQGGIIAAGALHALEHHRGRLVEDHVNARAFADGIAGLPGIALDPATVETNIIRFRVTSMPVATFAARLRDQGVLLLPSGRDGIRALTHLDVSRADIDRAIAAVASILDRPGSS